MVRGANNRQALADMAAQRAAALTAQNPPIHRLFTTTPRFLPYVAGTPDENWKIFVGHFALFEPESDIDVLTVRFSILVGIGAGVATFDFGLFEVQPPTVPTSPASIGDLYLEAKVIECSQRSLAFNRTISVYDRNIELAYDAPILLRRGGLYAVGLLSDTGGSDYLYCPSAAEQELIPVNTVFSTGGGVPRNVTLAPVLANSGGGAGLFELRDRYATHLYTGGADFQRY